MVKPPEYVGAAALTVIACPSLMVAESVPDGTPLSQLPAVFQSPALVVTVAFAVTAVRATATTARVTIVLIRFFVVIIFSC
jgi:hypothetical protein